jgi:RNA polymerase sigma-70 factor, ECF subfamily
VNRTELLERLRERIVRFAAFRLQGGFASDSAEDVAQEVLLVLHEKYPTLDRAEDLVPVSLEIARLKIWAARRKSVRRGEHTQVPVDDLPLASPEAGPLDLAEIHERTERLQAALAQLGDRCRELFRLKLEGLSFPEIQKYMDASSINTLYTWDFRCRKQLLEQLGGEWDRK